MDGNEVWATPDSIVSFRKLSLGFMAILAKKVTLLPLLFIGFSICISLFCTEPFYRNFVTSSSMYVQLTCLFSCWLLNNWTVSIGILLVSKRRVKQFFTLSARTLIIMKFESTKYKSHPTKLEHKSVINSWVKSIFMMTFYFAKTETKYTRVFWDVPLQLRLFLLVWYWIIVP